MGSKGGWTKIVAICLVVHAGWMVYGSKESAPPKKEGDESMLYDIAVKRITGEEITLREYAGKALLIVNTASKCGFTPQYEGLQKLFETYSESGLVVLGFPSNDFMRQEPGTADEIMEFCQVNYGVTFPMFDKVVVRQGRKQHPLYRYLTDKKTNPEHAGRIQWNFNKFLVSRDGRIVGRFGSRVRPDDADLVAAVEAALKQETEARPESGS